jgi:hypothetical protein
MFGGIRKRESCEHFYYVLEDRSYLGAASSNSLLSKVSRTKRGHFASWFLNDPNWKVQHEDAKIIIPPEFI